jgi:predicted NodU family carbamoyl transferase
VQQVRQQLGGRAEGLARLSRFPQPVERPERPRARAHQDPRLHAEGDRRDVRRIHREIEHHVVDHRDQRIAVLLQPGRANGFVQGRMEFGGQRKMLAQPPL